MYVTIVNDTRADANPGCQATMASLLRLVVAATGADTTTLPLGTGYQYFSHVDARQRYEEPHWRRAASAIARDAAVADALRRSDLIVVNLEGTFHHHTTGALTLGAIMAAAHDRGVPVWAVNGTVEAIEPWLLGQTLAKAKYVAAREPVSAQWLRAHGVRASLSADCAFLADIFAPVDAAIAEARLALYTPGVLARPDQSSRVSADTVLGHLTCLARRGWTPVYFEMEPDEAHISAEVRARGWRVVTVADVPWQTCGTFLRQFDLVVSGRYHVLIFAAMAGTPAIPLRSNTWKVEGLLGHLRDSNGVVVDRPALESRLDAGVQAWPQARIIRRCRVLARRNVTGHGVGCTPSSRTERGRLVLSASRPTQAAAVGDGESVIHVAWPPKAAGAAPEALGAAFHAFGDQHRAGAAIVDGLQCLLPDDVPAALERLRSTATGPVQIVLDSAPADAWRTPHHTVRPVSLWRRMLQLAGFEIVSQQTAEASNVASEAWSPRSHWRQWQPFRDAADGATCRLLVRPAAIAVDPAVLDRELRAALGLRQREPLPDALLDPNAQLVFLVGTYQEFRQYLPLWEQLPARTFSVLVRAASSADAGATRRQASIMAWLRGRGVEPVLIHSTRDVDWPRWRQARRVLVVGADSTAYDAHLWNASVVIAARDHGFATVQLQHGIWPYADQRGPMTLLSDVLLTWSDEFERALAQTVTWPDGILGPRGIVEASQFLQTGCPLFDAYADPSSLRLEDLLGDWVSRYATRVLVATNLHWSQHATGARVTPAIVDLAAQMPDTLFVLKPHPVHDLDPALLDTCPPNVVVLDEFCCLYAGLDSTRLVRATDAVIATQSTVALEAALARKPCVIVDTGNPNRYEHVATVDPDFVGQRLRDVLVSRPDDSPFRDHYYAAATMGAGARNVFRALATAAGVGPVSAPRGALAVSRLAEQLSVTMAELDAASVTADRTWKDLRAARTSYEREIEQARRDHAETQDELDWVRQAAIEDVGAFHAYALELEARCADLQRRIEVRDLALLGRRPGRRVRLVLYGASTAGRECLELVRAIPHLDPATFVDGDAAKWNTTVDGVPVVQPTRAVLQHADVIMISSMHAASIAARIAELGAGDRIVIGRDALQYLALRTQTA